MMFQEELTITTPGRGFTSLNKSIQSVISSHSINNGLCHLFLQHTSASLILCENADEQVKVDLEAFMTRLIPDGDAIFKHIEEGADDMPAHVRTILTQNSLLIPIVQGSLALGTWQSIYLWEHRLQPHHRKLIVSLF